ncbi:MAG: sigma-70 family RNA polymerase sigma factor [Bacteroidales bacterium]|nr:sigma-70 family RNA polymerase sigma factor [Bacteroidales bacterium]
MAIKKVADEEALVRDLQSPSKAKKAFDEMMRTYGEGIYWQIRKMVTNHDDALDLLQNVFLKAWNNIGNFRGAAKLSTWLYKIAINESINYLNKERQRRSLSSDDENDAYRLESIEADPYFDGDEAQVEFQKAIASLPEKQRLVFNMRYFDELHYDEMSEILGTSVGALKASYHHAVKKIESSLKDKDIF